MADARHVPWQRWIIAIGLTFVPALCAAAAEPDKPASNKSEIWKKIEADFHPPAEFANDFGPYRSPLKFYDGREVKTAADWPARRAEILKEWHGRMGEWPAIIDKPKIDVLATERRENFTQKKVHFAITPKHETDGYILIPDGEGRRPAVLVVFYDPETAVGLPAKPGDKVDAERRNRAFGLDLAQR